jgi:hypothetical protein
MNGVGEGDGVGGDGEGESSIGGAVAARSKYETPGTLLTLAAIRFAPACRYGRTSSGATVWLTAHEEGRFTQPGSPPPAPQAPTSVPLMYNCRLSSLSIAIVGIRLTLATVR